jgi:hypothetical protein
MSSTTVTKEYWSTWSGSPSLNISAEGSRLCAHGLRIRGFGMRADLNSAQQNSRNVRKHL